MANKEKSFSPPTTGGASLLTVFAVLCLTIFAILSLSTVRADRSLSDSSSGAIRAYYDADNKAQETLALIRLGEVPAEVSVQGDIYRYTVPVSENQELCVVVKMQSTNDYDILRWQTVPAGEWEYSNDMGLWDGELQTGECS